MKPGALGAVFEEWSSRFVRHDAATDELMQSDLPLAQRYFAGAGKAYMDEFGTPLGTFAKIRAKASRHAAKNPLALIRAVVTAQEVMESKMLWPGVLTRPMACPSTCGAAAAIVCSAAFAQKHDPDQGLRIRAQAMTTDRPITPSSRATCATGWAPAWSRLRQIRLYRHRRGRVARLLCVKRAAELRGVGPVPWGRRGESHRRR